jgi:hypothetical protein
MIDKELVDEIDNQNETAKLATELDGETINIIASFHSRKPNSISTSVDTIAIPRGAIEELVNLADEAEGGLERDTMMVVGAAKMLRAYLPEKNDNKESSDDAKSE